MSTPVTLASCGGGDTGLMRDFVQAVRQHAPALLASGAEVSLASHMMVFAAERARERSTVCGHLPLTRLFHPPTLRSRRTIP